jgi:hypothetical protein
MPAAARESGDVRAARDVVARLNDPETGGRYERWVERVRGCSRPVRLRGASHEADAATGELVREFASEREPDGVQLTPCGNRRAHVCPACSEVYRGDAWQVVVSGLRGGKGVPESVAGHPLVFATFTAPSFGPVHTIREAGGKRLACRPRRRGETCLHGRSLSCGKCHAEDDLCLGEAICPDCFNYERCALWNHNAGRLFKRTRTYVERELARQAGLTQKAARQRVRVSYVKVAEFQRRGVVHFHTLWRLDAPGDELAPPRDEFDAGRLADAITAAPAEGDRPDRGRGGRAVRMGPPARGPRAPPPRRLAGGRACGWLYRQVRHQVGGGHWRRRPPDPERPRAARAALPRPRAAPDHQRVGAGRTRGGRR